MKASVGEMIEQRRHSDWVFRQPALQPAPAAAEASLGPAPVLPGLTDPDKARRGDTIDTSIDNVQRSNRLFEQSKAYAETVFDPDVGLCYTRMNWKTHMVRDTLMYAIALLEGDDPGEFDRAARILDAVISTQDADPKSPACGSFKWNWEDEKAGAFNSAEFILPPLIHIYMTHGSAVSRHQASGRSDAARCGPGDAAEHPKPKISLDLENRILGAIERGQVAIKSRMLHLNYTNIALLSIFSQLAGGEILDNADSLTRGHSRLNEWITQTNTQGAPTEFNSPTYTGVDLLALAWMSRFFRSEEARLKARIMEERLWMQLAAHYHPPTKQIGGPYSRGYQNDVVGSSGLAKMILYKELGLEEFADYSGFFRFEMDHNVLWGIPIALLDFHLPPAIRSLFERKSYPYLTRETTDVVANAVHPSDITTWQTESFSLGSAGCNYHFIEHCNNLLLHFAGRSRSRALYSRLHLNDQIYGSSQLGILASTRTNDNDQGIFRSVQDEGRVIGLYGLRGETSVTGLRLDFVVPDYEGFDEVWVGDRRVGELPVDARADDTIFLREAKTCVAIRPLASLCAWQGKSVRIEVEDGYFYVSTVYYRGEERMLGKCDVHAGFVLEAIEAGTDREFTEFRSRAKAWRIADGVRKNGSARSGRGARIGRAEDLRSGWLPIGDAVSEMSEDGGDVANSLAGGEANVPAGGLREGLKEGLEEDRTEGQTSGKAPCETGKVREVFLQDGRRSLGIHWDLDSGRILDRWIDGEFFWPPMFTSPTSKQDRTGSIEIGDAVLRTTGVSAWLNVDAAHREYVVVNPELVATPVELETPRGVLRTDAFGFGKLVLRAGGPVEIEVHTLHTLAPIYFEEG